MPETHPTARLTRRRLLLVLGGSAASMGLLAVSGTGSAEISPREHHTLLNEAVAAVLAPAALAAAPAAAEPLAPFRQSTLAGFMPINSTLTFGAAADLASGWGRHPVGHRQCGRAPPVRPAERYVAAAWPGYRRRGADPGRRSRGLLPGSRDVHRRRPARRAGDQHGLARPAAELPAWCPGGGLGQRQGDALSRRNLPDRALAPARRVRPDHALRDPRGDRYARARGQQRRRLPRRIALGGDRLADGGAVRQPDPHARGQRNSHRGRAHGDSHSAGRRRPLRRRLPHRPHRRARPQPGPIVADTGDAQPGDHYDARGDGNGHARRDARPPPRHRRRHPLRRPTTWLRRWRRSSAGRKARTGRTGPSTVSSRLATAWFRSSAAVRPSQSSSRVRERLRPARRMRSAPFPTSRNCPPTGRRTASTRASVRGAGQCPATTSSPAARRPWSSPRRRRRAPRGKLARPLPPQPRPSRPVTEIWRPACAAAPRCTTSPTSHPSWPTYWHPTFKHAPTGRTSGLWAATVEGHVVSFDGTRWTQQPGDATLGVAGRDGACSPLDRRTRNSCRSGTGSALELRSPATRPPWPRWRRQPGPGLDARQWQRRPPAQPGPAATGAAGRLGGAHGRQLRRHAVELQRQRLERVPVGLGPGRRAGRRPGGRHRAEGGQHRFGAAHCLVAQNGRAQIYRYDSPYRLPDRRRATASDTGPIEQGLGNLFFVMQRPDSTRTGDPIYQVVALDGHTGQELSRSAIAAAGLRYTPPVFDRAPRDRHRRPDDPHYDRLAARRCSVWTRAT